MNIDVNPTIRIANDMEKVVMDLYDYHAMYCIHTSDGAEATVKWNQKSLGEFLPNKPVSEVLKMWQDGFNDQIKMYNEALENDVHPYWMDHKKVMVPGIIGPRWTGEMEEVPSKLTNDQRKFYEKEIIRLSGISGQLTFVKIITDDKDPRHSITVGSKWINRHGWGDVYEIHETPDWEKTVTFTVISVTDKSVNFYISYEGNPIPERIFENTTQEFLDSLKPKK